MTKENKQRIDKVWRRRTSKAATTTQVAGGGGFTAAGGMKMMRMSDSFAAPLFDDQ